MKIKKRIQSGRLVETIIYSAPCIADKNPRVRAEKKRVSTEAQKRLNNKHRWQKLMRLIAANFDISGYFCTLTYSDDHLPDGRKKAVGKMRRCIEAAKRQLERQTGSKDLPYIYITEEISDAGEPARLHHHMILNREHVDLIRRIWKWGSVDYERIDAFGYEQVAKYMCKERIQDDRVGARAWSQSKGLKKPVVETTYCKDDDDVTAPPGCHVLQDSGPVRTEFAEMHYLSYLIPHEPRAWHTRPVRSGRKE